MSPFYSRIILSVTLLVGGVTWWMSAQNLDHQKMLAYTPNVASLKGSPYGKILAFAAQGPIDFYWHQGQSHDDIEIFNAETNGEFQCAAGCAAGCEVHIHDHDHHSEQHGDTILTTEAPWHVSAKEEIKKLVAYTRRRTNEVPISPKHDKYLQSEIEDKLKFAYQLDPTNTTNYSNYYYFLSVSNLGRSEADLEKCIALAQETLSICKQDQFDPSSWVTAVVASHDIAEYSIANSDQYSQKEIDAYLEEFDFCLSEYRKVLLSSLDSKRFISNIRINEMEEHIRFTLKLKESLDVTYKRLFDH